MRRNRRDEWTRRLVAENLLTPADFLWPVFVHDAAAARAPIPSMPGVDRLSVSALVNAAGEAHALGIPVIALFPATPAERKTPEGDEALGSRKIGEPQIETCSMARHEFGAQLFIAEDRAGEVQNYPSVHTGHRSRVPRPDLLHRPGVA